MPGFRLSVSEEVKECFKENPELTSKTLEQIGQWFLIQGQVRQEDLRHALKAKVDFYRKCLKSVSSEEVLDSFDKEWEKELRNS